MRTCIYVDGFNLYYLALKNTSCKWLNLDGLFRDILQPQHNVTSIKYFTAPVLPRSHDPSQPQRQQIYLRALRQYCSAVEIIYGYFQSNVVSAPLAQPGTGPRMVSVIKTEEKGTDVNIAVHMLNDAWLNAYDCAVVVSNDGDLAEAMRLVKVQTGKKIGLLTPGSNDPSGSLMRHADFYRHIRSGALARNQLPSPIPGTNITKPASW
ncbi:MAG: NYN domain-containing protein [Rhodospirillales bacterium]